MVPETKAEPPQPRSFEEQPTKKIVNDVEKRLSFPGRRKRDYRHLCFEAGSILILAVAIGYLVWSVYSIILAKQSGANSSPPKESVSPVNPHSTNSINHAATGKGLQKMDQKESEKIPPTPTKEMKTDLHTSYPSKPIETEMQKIEKIKGLLEDIRQANLQKNIDYFISCYATDFKDREIKKKTTLESWKNFDFLDLSYDLKSPSISGDTATARVEWLMKISPKTGGQPQETKTILEVTFKKEGDGWRIGEIRPLS